MVLTIIDNNNWYMTHEPYHGGVGVSTSIILLIAFRREHGNRNYTNGTISASQMIEHMY